ncbi:alpha/beta hydrolase [Sanguibacter inulinus]|uniref:DUF1023 domain-containing protein n=1 Tax=Sanguibacter inulinus TaxID=60922 RepID=A0A853EVM2_9MICO|nr:alpha/beta hydrolase [Sanguibacter inulinus]MBF0723454.1 hypothetical protein [Sanguibacter inulinus]NYS94599.1 hypothetical protein [Sanguibacter inulinus]
MTRASLVGLREGGFLALDASAISDGAVDLRRAAGRVGDDGAQVSNGWRALTDVYQSPAATGLVTEMEPVGQVASEMSGAMQSATVALDDYARAISSLQARHHSVAVDAGVFARAAAASPDWRIEPTLRAQQSSLQRSVATLERDFDDARQQCVAVLDGIVAPAVQTTGSFARPGQGPEGEGRPGDGWWDPRHLFTSSSLDAMSPAEVNAWWTSLSPAAQATYLTTSPQMIGGLDGIPAAVRDSANRSRLDRELARLTAERDAMGFFERNVSDRRRSDELNERIDAIASVRAVLDRGGRQLLHFDITGPEVLAAVAIGDVDKARYVGILVGGLTTNVESGLAKMDSGALRLREMSRSVGKVRGSDVATVSWLGYAAPPEFPDSANPAFARAGQAGLRSFTEGLSASSNNPPDGVRVTLGVHSYGTLVGTLATQVDDGKVDSIVAYGSPGIAKTLPDDVARYWMRNDNDPIRAAVNLGWYKYQPSAADGWVELGTASAEINGIKLAEGVGHDYLDRGTTTLHNIAAVVMACPEEMVLR